MSRRSAIAEAPVEIWIEIIHQVFHDSVLFRIEHFYPGCNPHSAFREWYDPTHMKSYQNQRSALRLVSKSWKGLVDSQFGWLLEHSTSIKPASSKNPLVDSKPITGPEAPWTSARRVHIDVSPPDPCGWECMMGSGCLCPAVGYRALNFNNMRSEKRDLSKFKDLVLKLATRGPLPAEILVLQADVWSTICEELQQDTMSHLLSNICALEIPSRGGEDAIKIPDFLQRLTRLSIGYQSLEKAHARFPYLTTLQLCVKQRTLEVQDWDLPRLQHLEFEFRFKNTFHRSGLEFLRKGWPCLLTLSINLLDGTVKFPGDIWASLPKLQYLGCHPPPSVGRSGLSLQSDYPLRTFGFLFPEHHHLKKRTLMPLISNMPNLTVVADYYRWEDVELPPSGSLATPSDHPLTQSCGEVFCQTCIEEMYAFCTARNLRYEDRWGRSFEEFKRNHSV